MALDTLVAYSEVIGAISIVVSVVYLAYEVRSNTKVLKANAGRDAQREWAIVNENLYQFPDRMVIAKTFDTDSRLADLTEEEKQISFFFARSMVQRFEAEMFQYQAGLLDTEIWEAHRRWCAGFLSLPVFEAWWKSERLQSIYTQSFLDSVETSEKPSVTVGITGLGNA